MAALFPRWANAAMRAALVVLFLLLAGFPLGLMAWVRTPNATRRYAPVTQPVAFDHRIHAGALRIDCRYCHFSVERSAYAGLPPTQTCVPCHSSSWMAGAPMAPVRASLASGKPIPWQRVNGLPDFVFFNHAIHVTKGVGCESCHGRVDRMAQVHQTAPLTMGWCLDCHRMPEQHLRPVEQMTTMGYTPRESQRVLGHTLAQRYGVRSLTSCTDCHR
ncbi:MAG TPA: cytochrome c3 family protein [Gemmatimonadaceae bacterium]|nr:cytochrome c3 family protein [Gemmatimonadaceae bacterium]